MQMLGCYQYSKNTIILFATQYKDDNTAIHRISAASGSLELLRAFCQWKVEYHVRKCCVKGFLLRDMAGREKDAGHESGYKQ